MAGKKNFKEQAGAVLNNNPAMMFIDAPAKTTTAPKSEPKSRRVQLLMRPSTHTAIQKAADRCGISFNEWVNNALENALKSE